MTTGRDYLSSIISSIALLQNISDARLDKIKDGLSRVDSDLEDAVAYILEVR